MRLAIVRPLLAVAACLCCTLPAVAQAAHTVVPPAQVFDKLLTGEESEIVGLAEAMPAEHFNFAPDSKMGKFDGVRTFAAQVKHLTEANYAFFSTWGIAGGKSRADIDKLVSREDILAALRASYKFDHAAIATITAENAFVDMNGKGTTRAGTAAYALAHNNDHYGQMVEYLRMNGEIPPASRK
jgi:uncharacterized damage-inducible protein DinB